MNCIIGFDRFMNDAKLLPQQNKLFGEFLREGELVNLFAPTSYGKSALSYEIAFGIASGESEICGEVNELKRPLTTLYIDAELSAQQLAYRYRAKEIPPQLFFADFEKMQIELGTSFKITPSLIDNWIEEIGAKFIVLDNLGCFLNEPTNPLEAQDFVFDMKLISRKRQCTILIISHTTKSGMANSVKPIPINLTMMEGSYKISSYIDHAIGMSKAPDGTLYLRHLKARSGQSSDIVKLISIDMIEDGNLTASPSGYELLDVLFPLNAERSANKIDYDVVLQDVMLNHNNKMTWNHNDLCRAIEFVSEDITFENAKKMLKVMVNQGLVVRDNTKYLIVCQTETIAPSHPEAIGLIPIVVDAF